MTDDLTSRQAADAFSDSETDRMISELLRATAEMNKAEYYTSFYAALRTRFDGRQTGFGLI